MARMIDADALQELCNKRIQDTWNSGVAPVSWAAAYADFKDDIDSMPTLTPPNEPLTLEELREMDEEPVYVVPKDKPAHCGGWCGVTVWKCDRYSYVTLLRDADSGWGFEEYGKTWIAYRRPPEGEEET